MGSLGLGETEDGSDGRNWTSSGGESIEQDNLKDVSARSCGDLGLSLGGIPDPRSKVPSAHEGIAMRPHLAVPKPSRRLERHFLFKEVASQC
jgi:hypothetical protein